MNIDDCQILFYQSPEFWADMLPYQTDVYKFEINTTMNKKEITEKDKSTNSANKFVDLSKSKRSEWIISLHPKSIYDELAEAGYLSDYLNSYFPDRMKQDAMFRENMVNTFYRSSSSYTPEVEIYCLEMLCNSLEYFLEYNKKWLDRK